MARVIYTSSARRDALQILEALATDAGTRTSREFAHSFEKLFDRLAEYPEAYARRSDLGPDTRIGVVSPYLIIHRYDEPTDTVTILRILDGRRQIGPDFMRLR